MLCFVIINSIFLLTIYVFGSNQVCSFSHKIYSITCWLPTMFKKGMKTEPSQQGRLHPLMLNRKLMDSPIGYTCSQQTDSGHKHLLAAHWQGSQTPAHIKLTAVTNICSPLLEQVFANTANTVSWQKWPRTILHLSSWNSASRSYCRILHKPDR